MNGTGFAVLVTGLLLVWRIAIDFVPMFPLNDLSRKSVKSRTRDWAVHYIPLGLVLLLNLSPNRLAVAAGLVIALLYAVVQAVTWWIPYWQGGSESQEHRWEHQYGRTHRFLPSMRGRIVPDTSHVITGALTIVMAVGISAHLWTGTGGTAKIDTATVAPAATDAAPQKVETAFTQSGQKPEQLLIQVYKSAKSTLDIAISAINHEEIVAAILDARIRGVQVRVITDRTESANAAQSDKLKSLLEAGIPVKENSRKGLMDLKMSIVDDQTATTGSFNYTVNASTSNDEMLVVLREPETAKQWKKQFDAMWNDTQNFRDLKLGVVPKK
ncbi:phospholipase D-like domain-containing protein [Gorillibacterium sp. sgz5001074]|uniref:phospholipase D-like domain-containing protein n=1 Tax=Gorillibacterium sp. sgz5001074 TaxID=3446695 RepID=UPI003F663A54